MQEKKTLTFGVDGKFITDIAREWLFYEGKDFDKVMELLLSCMGGTDMTPERLKRYAEDVLLGRAEFSGSTADGSFHMTVFEPEEQPKVPDRFNIFRKLSSEISKRKELEKDRDKYREWYSTAMEHVPEYAKNKVLEETGQPIDSRYGSFALDSFVERMLDEEEHSTGDYGWLSPGGEFYEVDWGNHQEWAQRFIEENFPETDEDTEIDMQVKCNVGLIGAGDWLVERGWVLLHNPSQGIAIPTKNPTKRYTKKQQEFLYDYYMERGKEKEANRVYEE